MNTFSLVLAHWTYLEHKGKKVRAEIISQNSWELNFEQGVDLSINYLSIFWCKFPSSIGEESGSWVPLVAATPRSHIILAKTLQT
jgi:hypothetical protein